MNIKPLGDRIVVKAIEREEKTESGIVLPDTAKEKPQEGEVVAVGEGKRLENGERLKPEVEVGDRIIYAKYAGTEVQHKRQELLIVSEKDILAVIE